MPLQRGLWLLRRLRPLSCTLAFSRPVAGSSSGRVPQFRVDVFAQPLAARYTPGVSWENPHGCVSREAPTPSPFWSSVSAAFTCPNSRRFKHGFLSSAWVTGVALVSVSAQRLRYIVSGLHTLRSAAPPRMPLPPRIVLLMGLFRRHVRSLKGALHNFRYGITPFRLRYARRRRNGGDAGRCPSATDC